MATTKDAPAPAPARVAPPVVKTAAMKAAPPVVMKSAAVPQAAAPAVPAGEGMSRETLVIAFVDLARFQIASRRVKDAALVELLEEYYGRIVDGLKPAGGRVVKFMGDGALVVFGVDRASQAARALVMLKSDVDARFAKKKFVTPLVARVHVGEVMAGAFGPKGDKRYDVIGQAVNRTAAMRAGEVIALTPDAYAKLDAKTQKLFKQKGDAYVPV
ncbi:MAG: adenylate/guanylate cyclase domain-containing protein [Polyangiaceae bacterium]